MTCTLPRPAINCCKQGINTDVCAYQRKPLALWHSGTPVASSCGLWLASRSSNQGTWVSGAQTGGLFESAEHCGTSNAGVAQDVEKAWVCAHTPLQHAAVAHCLCALVLPSRRQHPCQPTPQCRTASPVDTVCAHLFPLRPTFVLTALPGMLCLGYKPYVQCYACMHTCNSRCRKPLDLCAGHSCGVVQSSTRWNGMRGPPWTIRCGRRQTTASTSPALTLQQVRVECRVSRCCLRRALQ